MVDLTDAAVDDPVDDDDEVVDLDRLETVSEDIRHFAQQFQQAPSREVYVHGRFINGLSEPHSKRSLFEREERDQASWTAPRPTEYRSFHATSGSGYGR